MAGSNHTGSARASDLPGGDGDHVRIEDMILVTEDAAGSSAGSSTTRPCCAEDEGTIGGSPV
jgi:hypothetical protein